MSPSEFELRDALRHGEGDGVDPDALIGGARQLRHARRVRFGAIAASVMAVGVIGTGTAQLMHHNATTTQASKDAAGRAQPATAPSNRAAPSNVTAYGAGRAAMDSICPPTVPRLALPGGGGTGLFGGGDPLFGGAVTSIHICGYPVDASATSTVLTGADAAQLAASLEGAAKTRSVTLCPYSPTKTGQLVFVATSADGHAVLPAVATLHCTWTVTNGTAVRYDWKPPASVTGFIDSVSANNSLTGVGPPRASGSPAH